MTVAVFQPGAAGIDCHIKGDSPDTAHPNDTVFQTTPSGDWHGLIKFDVSSLAGAYIVSASLEMTSQGPAARSSDVHAILAANDGWTEGATWNYADGAGASQRWAGDVATFITGASPAKTVEAIPAAVVQAWVDGNNYGLVFLDATSSPWWATGDNATPAYRPKLTIAYIEDSVVLQPAAAAGKDTKIWYDNDTNNLNFGVNQYCASGYFSSTNTSRQLIQFDLSSLPDDAIIVNAVYALTVGVDYASASRTHAIYRMKQAWVEGTGSASETNDGATWLTYDGSNSWTTAGGFDPADCEQTPIGSKLLSASETGVVEITLTPTTKAGLDLGQGWMMKQVTEDAACTYDWCSSDHATPANRPKLTIYYTLPGGKGGLYRIIVPFKRRLVFGG
jgi:hypothetical protein